MRIGQSYDVFTGGITDIFGNVDIAKTITYEGLVKSGLSDFAISYSLSPFSFSPETFALINNPTLLSSFNQAISTGQTWGDFFKDILKTGILSFAQYKILEAQADAMKVDRKSPVSTQSVDALYSALAQQKPQVNTGMIIGLAVGGMAILMMMLMFSGKKSKK